MLRRAREVVMGAMDSGWTGPPFDPIALADHLGVAVAPRVDIRDARSVPAETGRIEIQFNPNRPRGRMRYSVAHELAHTLFPDCADRVRNRAAYHELVGDDWQLEALCNIGAAEFLMPTAALPPVDLGDISIRDLLEVQNRFDVSMEALLIRVVRHSSAQSAMFCASRLEDFDEPQYRVDYTIGSASSSQDVPRGFILPKGTAVAECTAIGYTAVGDELWPALQQHVHVECVGVPPYPGARYPRVVGFLRFADTTAIQPSCPRYLVGDATDPRGSGHRVITHIVNDKTPRWGGGGFAQAVRRKWPEVQEDFIAWAAKDRDNLSLGRVHVAEISSTVAVVQMIAQHGYGPSRTPRIRYGALATCLDQVADIAEARRADIHMPRIGVGNAGGAWDLIEELLRDTFCGRGLRVTVYDLSGSRAVPGWTMPLFDPHVVLPPRSLT